MRSRSRLICWLVCVAPFLASHAAAEEFSWQLGGGFSDGEVGPVADTESASLSATYYFGRVDDATGPYALAPFLQRASHVGLSYHEDKTSASAPTFNFAQGTSPPNEPGTIVTRASGRALAGRYVFGDAGWYVGAALAEGDAAGPAPLPVAFSVLGEELESRSVTFGRYLGRTTAIGLSLETAEASLQSQLSVPCTGLLCAILAQPFTITSTFESEQENVAVSAQHVGNLGRMHYALSGFAATGKAETIRELVATQPLVPLPAPPSLAFGPAAPGGVAVPGFGEVQDVSERSERYELVGELFPTQALGLRVGYARWDGDIALDKSYEVGASWFFRRNVGAEVLLSRTKSRLSIATVRDLDTVGIRFVGRL